MKVLGYAAPCDDGHVRSQSLLSEELISITVARPQIASTLYINEGLVKRSQYMVSSYLVNRPVFTVKMIYSVHGIESTFKSTEP